MLECPARQRDDLWIYPSARIRSPRRSRRPDRGFRQALRLFRESSAGAKARFEAADWAAVQEAVRERIPFYDDRVKETVERLHHELRAESLDHAIWQQAKLLYMGLLINHKRRTGRDILQLGVVQDPAPDLFQQRLHLFPSGDFHRIHRI